jgi:hypothetical protein
MNKIKLIITSIIILFVVDLSLVYIFLFNIDKMQTPVQSEPTDQQHIKEPVNFTLTIPSGDVMIIGDCIKRDK